MTLERVATRRSALFGYRLWDLGRRTAKAVRLETQGVPSGRGCNASTQIFLPFCFLNNLYCGAFDIFPLSLLFFFFFDISPNLRGSRDLGDGGEAWNRIVISLKLARSWDPKSTLQYQECLCVCIHEYCFKVRLVSSHGIKRADL